MTVNKTPLPAKQQPADLALHTLALTALYLGVTGYGGPAIISHMKQVFVARKQWITEQEFMSGLSLSQLLPGATAVELIQYLGFQLFGAWGALVAPVSFIAPAVLLMTLLSAIYFAVGQVPFVTALFTGLGAVVVALLANATITLGRSAIRSPWAGALACITFALTQWLHVHLLIVILLSAIVGWTVAERRKNHLAEPISSAMPTVPKITRRFWGGVLIVVFALTIILIVTAHTGGTQLVVAMLRVGALAFGGGFTSVPLFQHEAITAHPWLNLREFLDGIALGQITPGPVVVTATFIGYRVWGIWGAVCGTLAIFLPGWVFMLILAHYHERVKHYQWLQAMVRGIVAGFIGVLASVTVSFAVHSLTEWRTMVMAGAALIVLVAWKKDPLWVILGGAILSPLLFS